MNGLRTVRPRALFTDDDVRAVVTWQSKDLASFNAYVAAHGKLNPNDPAGPMIRPPFVDLVAEARRRG